jgi:hypothetical protein
MEVPVSIDHELYLPRTREDADKVFAIVDRANVNDRASLSMDLFTVHNTVGLKLDELLAADDFNFFHDLSGITRHLNRATGELEDFFVPRFHA